MNQIVDAGLRNVSLDDKYAATNGAVYLTGTQALVRLPLMQRQRDLAAGLNTGGYISGYRGSQARAMTASSRSGTARGRASTAAVMRSGMPTRRAARRMAA